jgi:hypothetical protein
MPYAFHQRQLRCMAAGGKAAADSGGGGLRVVAALCVAAVGPRISCQHASGHRGEYGQRNPAGNQPGGDLLSLISLLSMIGAEVRLTERSRRVLRQYRDTCRKRPEPSAPSVSPSPARSLTCR